MADRKYWLSAEAIRVANTMLAIDMVLALFLANDSGQTDVLSLLFVLLSPAIASLILAALLTWIPSIRPPAELHFPMNLTYPVLSSALVYGTAVLTCAKSPSIVALESEASSLFLWTNYVFIVASLIIKVVLLSLFIIFASYMRRRRKPDGPLGE